MLMPRLERSPRRTSASVTFLGQPRETSETEGAGGVLEEGFSAAVQAVGVVRLLRRGRAGLHVSWTGRARVKVAKGATKGATKAMAGCERRVCDAEAEDRGGVLGGGVCCRLSLCPKLGGAQSCPVLAAPLSS